MTDDGDLPKLFNYNGRRFDIKDTIGQFDKSGDNRLLQDKNGKLVDLLGRPVNSKGYLIDHNRKVIDTNKLGQFDKNKDGSIKLLKDKNGKLVDKLGRPVNGQGYIIDENGNIIGDDVIGKFNKDKNGDIVFKKDANGKLTDKLGRPVNG